MTSGHALSPELVAAHTGALRALALSLAGDEHAADDVLQDTFVRALVAPPPRRDRIGGWLTRVARGFAVDRRRSEARRAERERRYAAERPEAFDAEARGEVARAVIEAVVALREPYKTTVLLRYFDGLPPREIAARLGVSVATVDSRLQRAHALLRERLEREIGPRTGGARSALLALAGAKGSVEVGAATAWTLVLGGFAVTLKSLFLGAAILLALVLSFFAFRSRPAAPASPQADETVAAAPDERTSVAAAGPEEIAPESDVARRDPAPERVRELLDALAPLEPLAPEPGPYEFDLEIVPLDASGHPLAAVDVWIAPAKRPLNHFGSTEWNGALRKKWRGFEREVDAVFVAKREGFGVTPLRRVRLSANGEQRFVIALDAPRGLLVADPNTGELAFDPNYGESWRAPVGAGGGDQKPFELDQAGNGVFTDPWVCRHESIRMSFQDAVGYALSVRESIALQRLGYADVAFEVASAFENCASIEGVAVDRKGRPVAGALASVVTEKHAFRSDTRTDAEGRFWLFGLPCGPAYVLVGDAEHGFDRGASARKAIELREGETVKWTAVLEPPAPLTVRLADDAGRPLAGWYVEARSADQRGEELAGRAITDAAGAARIDARTDAPLRLFARPASSPGAPKALAAKYVRPGAGEVAVAVEGASELASISVLVEAPVPLAALAGDASAVASDEAEVRAWRVDSGEGVVLERKGATHIARGLIPGRYEIEVGAPRRGWRTLGTFDLQEGGAITLEARGLDLPSPLTLGVALPADGALRVAVDFVARDQGALVRREALDLTLPATLSIAPGEYEVEIARETGPGAERSILHRERVSLAPGGQTTLGIATSRAKQR